MLYACGLTIAAAIVLAYPVFCGSNAYAILYGTARSTFYMLRRGSFLRSSGKTFLY